MKILTCILDLVFPRKCGICGKLGDDICDKCYKKFQKMEIRYQYNDIFFVYRYEGIIRKVIIKYKFDDKGYLHRAFATSLIKNKKVCKFIKGYDIIIPVPLHKKRKAQRGYNQSELIARELARLFNNQRKKKKVSKKSIICLGNVLVKNKNITPQSEKGIKQRLQEIKGIYEVKNKEVIQGKKIVLFDDIYTTGSTANECRKVLLEAGAEKVGILTLAKDYINLQ